MIDVTILRTRRRPQGRAHVAHAFTDEDYWFPFRSALCGKELAAEQLTDEGICEVTVCTSCAKRMTDAEELAA